MRKRVKFIEILLFCFVLLLLKNVICDPLSSVVVYTSVRTDRIKFGHGFFSSVTGWELNRVFRVGI